MRHSLSAEALGPDHGVEQAKAHEKTEHEQEHVHHYTRSQNRMNRSSAANAARPSRIIPSSSISDFLSPEVGGNIDRSS
jgi:hypothetical protein